MILAGDCGGTKTRFALFDASSNKVLQPVNVDTFESKAASSLEEILNAFLTKYSAHAAVTACCIGVPGPVVDGEFRATNLPWALLHEAQLGKVVGIANLKFVNDLVATIAAIPNLSANDLVEIYAGEPEQERNIFAMLAPGTGLGQAYMVRSSHGYYIPRPSEGGHVEFAPKNELEIELLRYLVSKLKGRVSIERVLCGPGLVNIYSFLKDTKVCEEPNELRDEMANSQPAKIITKHGLSAQYEICSRALEIFVSLLGSQAGDLVLTYLATGGIYLGGGIPPKILPALKSEALRSAYLRKGRLSSLVRATPIYVVKDDHAALLGAASIALQGTQD